MHQEPLASAAPHTTRSGPPTQPQRTQRKGPTEGTRAVNGSHSIPRQPAVQHHIRPVFCILPLSWPGFCARLRLCAAGSVVLHACPTVYVRCPSGTPRLPPSRTSFFFFSFCRSGAGRMGGGEGGSRPSCSYVSLSCKWQHSLSAGLPVSQSASFTRLANVAMC